MNKKNNINQERLEKGEASEQKCVNVAVIKT